MGPVFASSADSRRVVRLRRLPFLLSRGPRTHLIPAHRIIFSAAGPAEVSTARSQRWGPRRLPAIQHDGRPLAMRHPGPRRAHGPGPRPQSCEGPGEYIRRAWHAAELGKTQKNKRNSVPGFCSLPSSATRPVRLCLKLARNASVFPEESEVTACTEGLLRGRGGRGRDEDMPERRAANCHAG